MICANLTDDELLRRLATMSDLTPLETVLAARLRRALEEVDVLVSEQDADERSRRDAEARHEAYLRGNSPLALIDALVVRKGAR